MAELTGLQHTILETLSIQKSGYLTSPDASAFVAVGLHDSQQVHEELVGMQEEKWVEFIYEEEHRTIIKVEKDENGDPIFNEDGTIQPILDEENQIVTEDIVAVVDSGWVITDKGLEALK